MSVIETAEEYERLAVMVEEAAIAGMDYPSIFELFGFTHIEARKRNAFGVDWWGIPPEADAIPCVLKHYINNTDVALTLTDDDCFVSMSQMLNEEKTWTIAIAKHIYQGDFYHATSSTLNPARSIVAALLRIKARGVSL